MPPRTFPFIPKSTADLQLGDLIAVPGKTGTWGVLQVSGLTGASDFEVALLGWGGANQPSAADVSGMEADGHALTSMELFIAPGLQVVDSAPLAERWHPDGEGWEWGGGPGAVWDWRTAIRKAQKLALLCGPRVPPVEIFHGPGFSHGWVVHVERHAPGAGEAEYSRLGSAFSMLTVEQLIADYLADSAKELARSVFSFDRRDLYLADGTWFEFWWVLEAGGFDCPDCGMNTIDEYYFLHDEIWDQATYPDGDRLFCIGCVEARLGRQLTRNDFRSRAIEETGQTARLVDRLTRD